MTAEEWKVILRQIAPKGKPAIINGLANAMPDIVEEYQINTVNRVSHWLGQIAHESDYFKATEEYASGAAYEGRRDLGNRLKGDGRRFKGRGLIQLTGRANYMAASQALGYDFVGDPSKVAKFPHAATVSAWFWNKNALNKHADRDDIVQVTRIINGGLRHLDRRKVHTAAAKKALA